LEPKKNLKIESKILGETVRLVMNPPPEDTKMANYTIEEVGELDRLSLDSDELKTLHRLKKEFNGVFIAGGELGIPTRSGKARRRRNSR